MKLYGNWGKLGKVGENWKNCKVTRGKNPFQHQDRRDKSKYSRETEQSKEIVSKEWNATLVSKKLQTIKAMKEEQRHFD